MKKEKNQNIEYLVGNDESDCAVLVSEKYDLLLVRNFSSQPGIKKGSSVIRSYTIYKLSDKTFKPEQPRKEY